MYHNFLHTEPKRKGMCPNCSQMNGNNSNKCQNKKCRKVFKKPVKEVRRENQDLLAKVAELESKLANQSSLALQPRARSVSRGRSVSRDRVNSFDLPMVEAGAAASAAAAPSAHAEGRLSDAIDIYAFLDERDKEKQVEQRLGRLCKKLGEMDTDTLGAKLEAIEKILKM